MKYALALPLSLAVLLLSSCAKKETSEAPAPGAETAQPAAQQAQPAAEPGPRAFVHLKDGTRVPGTIVASSKTDMVLAGDDGIERKIPLDRVKSVEYANAGTEPAAMTQPRTQASTPKPPPVRETPARSTTPATDLTPQPTKQAAAPVQTLPPPVTTKTFELPAGSEISVRTNEDINSETAGEGQSFDAQVTRDATDVNGDVVIPRRADARVVIRSASGGGRIKGASDLVLDLQSVTINGRPYSIDTADVTKSGKSGVGANQRTATHVGGGAALGAIIGAIAGGGKGAAIGAASGAGAGAVAQILTKGKAIKVPAESVLTFKLDKPLKVTRAD
jgi:hypothetical protein